MTSDRNERAYRTVWLVRRLFRAMASRADDHLQETGLSAADRAVMEFLYPGESLSVPDIARRYDVSRQHVQVTVNRLLQPALLESVPNPQHKRSPLLRLSGLGRDAYEEIRRNETDLVNDLFADVSDDALEITQQTIESLLQKLK